MIIRKLPGRESGYSIIPNSTLNDNLSWAAKGMLVYLCSKPDDWQVSIMQLINHTKECLRPSGRDQTYAILRELIAAGYVRKCNRRGGNGEFSGIDYVVSSLPLPTEERETAPLTENPGAVEPHTDLPDTDFPYTANRKQQSKDSNKVKNKQNGDFQSPSLFNAFGEKEEKEKKRAKRNDYPEEFELFFKLYPKTRGSKKEAFRAWKRLNKTEKEQLNQSIEHYKAYLESEPWQKPMYPAKYIRGENHITFATSQSVLEPAESVYVNGRPYQPETIIELCRAYFSSSVWKFEDTMGPAPDRPNTLIPDQLIAKAKEN